MVVVMVAVVVGVVGVMEAMVIVVMVAVVAGQRSNSLKQWSPPRPLAHHLTGWSTWAPCEGPPPPESPSGAVFPSAL